MTLWDSDKRSASTSESWKDWIACDTDIACQASLSPKLQTPTNFYNIIVYYSIANYSQKHPDGGHDRSELFVAALLAAAAVDAARQRQLRSF